MSPRASPPPPTLRGHWLLFARMAWVVVTIMALAIVVFSVPSSFEHYSSVCTATTEVCSSDQRVGQPTPEGVRALQDAGLSVHTYALLNVIVDKVFQLVWLVVGVLIFWRRSDDWMAVLVSLFLVTFGPITVDSTDAEALISSQPAWLLPVSGVQIVGLVCSTLFFLLFPGGRFVPRWTRWLAVAFIARNLSEDSLSGVVLRFARPGVDFIQGVLGNRGERYLVPGLSLPENLLSRATSADQVGRIRHDPGYRGNLPLPAAGGPRFT